MATAPKKAKKPSDRKKKGEDKAPRPEDTPGWHLLKPFDEVPVWDQGPLLALVYELQGDAEDGSEIELSSSDVINYLGPIAKALLPMTTDEEAFTKFASGREGASNVMQLAFAWMASLGEEKSSAGN